MAEPMDEGRPVTTLKLLGGASLVGPDGPLTGPVVQRQRLALLALLALSPTGRLSRDKLLAYLWADADAERARHALSNALYTIKRALGEGAVEAVGEDLQLDREMVAVDVLEFGDAIAQGELEQAAAVYAGPLLDGIHLKDAPEFETWVDAERGRLARAYGELLEQLAGQATAEGRHTDALEWWRRRAALDPYDSRVALALMRALDVAGNRAEAIRHAALHANLMREELGADPDPAVAKLAKALRGVEPPGHPARWILPAIVVVALALVALWLTVIR
jgi:DNA-binding SARP family transcriptional activator